MHDDGSGPGVWILGGESKVKFRPVEIASVAREEVVVSRGVAVGDTLVSLGAHLLHEGQVVKQANEEKDFIVHPPGECHQLFNDGDVDLRLYVIVDNPVSGVVRYPDSGKWFVKSMRKVFRDGEAGDNIFEGEE